MAHTFRLIDAFVCVLHCACSLLHGSLYSRCCRVVVVVVLVEEEEYSFRRLVLLLLSLVSGYDPIRLSDLICSFAFAHYT